MFRVPFATCSVVASFGFSYNNNIHYVLDYKGKEVMVSVVGGGVQYQYSNCAGRKQKKVAGSHHISHGDLIPGATVERTEVCLTLWNLGCQCAPFPCVCHKCITMLWIPSERMKMHFIQMLISNISHV